jgi:adenosylcobinamide-phosphate synthase
MTMDPTLSPILATPSAWWWALSVVLAMAVSCGVDRLWGEPPTWAHPVVAMGRYLGAWGPRLWALPAPQARLGGVLAWWLGALLVMSLALSLEIAITASMAVWLQPDGAQTPGLAGWATCLFGKAVLMGLLLKPMMAWRMLHDEVQAVDAALGSSLQAGQQQLARLVSRDVRQLDDTAVRESAIETLAENLNDSVVAPLFWFVLGGLPAAALYRFANTADAMWGYRDHREAMGWWAARSDDVLSWLPARLTALALCVAAGRWPGWPRLRHEATLTSSPNGGWPMGAMALLLGVCLRKPGVYTLHARGRAATPADVQQALAWSRRAVGVAVLGLGLALCLITLCVPWLAATLWAGGGHA